MSVASTTTLQRIAVALERIAVALEKSAQPAPPMPERYGHPSPPVYPYPKVYYTASAE